jgi:GTPase SAR1 family protein
MNPKGNEFQITMLGASGVGKTTLLLAMYEKLDLIAKDIGFDLIPDEETQQILDKYLEQLKSLQNEMRADERDKGLRGTKAIAGPDSLPKYVFDLVYKKTKMRLVFRDYPGGYLTSKDQMEREFVKKLIQESYGVIVTIDTPAMLEPKRENFQDRRNWDISNNSGKWHQSRNQPQEVLELLTAACAKSKGSIPKLR